MIVEIEDEMIDKTKVKANRVTLQSKQCNSGETTLQSDCAETTRMDSNIAQLCKTSEDRSEKLTRTNTPQNEASCEIDKRSASLEERYVYDHCDD